MKAIDNKLLKIENLNFSYGKQEILKNVNLEFNSGVYCLLGKSGSGKTTLAKIISTLLKNYKGNIFYNGMKYNLESKRNIRFLRSNIRLIFQSPETTLNPRMTIYKILKEPLKLYSKEMKTYERLEEIYKMLDKVRLSEVKNDIKIKFISQLSGGQKRRLAIARALISRPKLIIADEPTEGLDISLQGGIIELFREFNIPMLLITHNYTVAAALSNKIGVMYNGEIIEEIDSSINNANHPFTISIKDALKEHAF